METNNSILLIDDDKINNYINVRLFKKQNSSCTISIARNGEEGLRLLEKTPNSLPDFIFLDIEMPIMNGIKFLDEYFKVNQQGNPEAKIVILAAAIHPKYEKVLATYPIHSFLIKPLTSEKIQNVMNDNLSALKNINPATLSLLEPNPGIYPDLPKY